MVYFYRHGPIPQFNNWREWIIGSTILSLSILVGISRRRRPNQWKLMISLDGFCRVVCRIQSVTGHCWLGEGEDETITNLCRIPGRPVHDKGENRRIDGRINRRIDGIFVMVHSSRSKKQSLQSLRCQYRGRRTMTSDIICHLSLSSFPVNSVPIVFSLETLINRHHSKSENPGTRKVFPKRGDYMKFSHK